MFFTYDLLVINNIQSNHKLYVILSTHMYIYIYIYKSANLGNILDLLFNSILKFRLFIAVIKAFPPNVT